MSHDTPTLSEVARRLIALAGQLDKASEMCDQASMASAKADTEWIVNSAKARMAIRARAIDRGVKVTVQEVEDEALLRCQDELMAKNTSEAIVRSARDNVKRISTQIDLTRSVGTLTKAEMDLS